MFDKFDKWLMFQNYISDTNQANFDDIVEHSDDPIRDIDSSLDCGFLIYDMLNDESKDFIDTYIS